MARFNYSGTTVEARTAIGADPARKLVWIACFDKASDHFVITKFAQMGATIGVGVDGGTSMALVIGNGAKECAIGNRHRKLATGGDAFWIQSGSAAVNKNPTEPGRVAPVRAGTTRRDFDELPSV